jgi:hypothetical protein
MVEEAYRAREELTDPEKFRVAHGALLPWLAWGKSVLTI